MKRYVRVLFICHGNICRSPLAHLYFQDYVKKQGLEGLFYVDSAATSYEEIGNPVHPGSQRKLKEAGISCEGKYARHMEKSDYQEFDYLIGMDQANIRNMMRIAGGDLDGKIYKMLEFAGNGWKQAAEGWRNLEKVRDVADPWYTGNFEDTWEDVTAGCEGFLKFLKASGKI